MTTPTLFLLATLGACGDTKNIEPDSGTVPSGVEADANCDSPGSPTTSLPAPSSDAAAINVTALECTRTAVALACELGVAHAYTESIDGVKRVLTANGIVDHDVGDFPNPGNPNVIAAQVYSASVPVTPAGTGSGVTSGVQVFGILFSGAVLDPGTAEAWNDDPAWRYEALRYGTAGSYFGSDSVAHPTALGVDCNLAHVQPGGAYHYHGVPTSLVPATPQVRHVGWAADGYPIVVTYGHTDGDDVSSEVRAMRASYRVKSGSRPSGSPGGAYDGTFGADWEYVAGLGDLDACNGRVDTFAINGTVVTTYAYVLTDTFPYIPRCFTAAPDPSFSRSGGGGDTGGGTGAPADCAPGQTERCCGDGTCDGPETADNCAADCE